MLCRYTQRWHMGMDRNRGSIFDAIDIDGMNIYPYYWGSIPMDLLFWPMDILFTSIYPNYFGSEGDSISFDPSPLENFGT